MKIAHIVRRFVRSEWGGTETVVDSIVAEQLRLGHDVRVFCTKALQPAVFEPPPCGCRVETFDYFYPYFPMPGRDRLALDKKGGSPYSPALFKAVREFAPDVIHIHAGGRLAASAVRLGEKLHVPTVYSLHGGCAAVPEREMEEMMRPMRGKLRYGGVLDRLFGLRFDAVSRATAVIAISHEEQRRLAAIYGEKRIRYLPNGIPAGRSLPVRSATGDGRRRILCVSRIDYQKNQLALVEALAKLPPEWCLQLVGPVTAAWYKDKIHSRAQELGLGERLEMTGALPPGSDELESRYAAADVFVLPSVHEPFGIVALEAMQREVPLVASAVGGLVDFVQDGVNALAYHPEGDNGEKLADLIVKAYEKREKLVAGGKITAGEYAWSDIVKRLMRIYNGENV